VLELSLRESRQLGHDYIGTEHILLGLLREGEGVAAQVLVKLGADLNRVRQQVIELLHGHPGAGLPAAPGGPPAGRPPPDILARVTAIEQRVGSGPDTGDLDEQIAQARRDKQSAIDAQDFDQAVSLRDREKRLLAGKTARQQQWQASQPDLASLAEQVQQLTGEVERLRDLLCQHGINAEDNTA
jgi:ATP-dependent Clp protease ATP-binding subunit ClpA